MIKIIIFIKFLIIVFIKFVEIINKMLYNVIMGKFLYKNITGLHLELTTKCNAMCAMCNRNFKGKIRDNLEITELSLEDCKKILTKEFLKKLKLISLCGVFGEPVVTKDLLEIIDYIYDNNPNVFIYLFTNGSYHDTKWWEKLAKSMKNGITFFGIDGIGDCHSLHRANTKYDKIIENAKAYISAGGRAQWDYIVFKHNENQVEDAKKLSEELGFEKFNIKKTSRFFKSLYESDSALDSTILPYGHHPVYNSNGNIKYEIELPDNKLYRNSTEDIILKLKKDYGELNNFFDQVQIDCQSIKTGGIFISAKGEVYPCCTVYQQVCYGSFFGVTDESELNEYKYSINENLSAFNKSIKEIVEGTFFKKIQESWSKKCIKDGKSKSCCRTCGNIYDSHSAQHS